MDMSKNFWILTMIICTVTACSQNNAPHNPGTSKQVFVGLASFYDGKFDGKPTASGESYDPTQMTAANRTLPFGTRVRVTNLENNKSVIVTISDRGPQQADRIIDLSFAAAQQLNMLSAGVVKVRVEVLDE